MIKGFKTYMDQTYKKKIVRARPNKKLTHNLGTTEEIIPIYNYLHQIK